MLTRREGRRAPWRGRREASTVLASGREIRAGSVPAGGGIIPTLWELAPARERRAAPMMNSSSDGHGYGKD